MIGAQAVVVMAVHPDFVEFARVAVAGGVLLLATQTAQLVVMALKR